MNIESLFTCSVPVLYKDLSNTASVAYYDLYKDEIVMCNKTIKNFPLCKDIVYLHEMFHSSGYHKRSLRRLRLDRAFEENAGRVEECIAEICTMISLHALGMLTSYTTLIPEDGINKNYGDDIYIPWVEVVSTLNYFKNDGINLYESTSEIKRMMNSKFNMNIKDNYERSGN